MMVDERRGGRHAASSGGYGGGPKPPVGNRRLAGETGWKPVGWRGGLCRAGRASHWAASGC
ncbi:MAG: hypothetical protein KIT77_28360, partial [Caldilinea sp.]|nr:hypothetical protein [Caldilinea sp.]